MEFEGGVTDAAGPPSPSAADKNLEHLPGGTVEYLPHQQVCSLAQLSHLALVHLPFFGVHSLRATATQSRCSRQ